MDVAVGEFKARLSAYLQRAAAGEHITVTDGGRPVAVLGPPIGTVDLKAVTEPAWLSRATSTGLKPLRRHQPLGPVQGVLDEDRTE